MTAGVFFNNFEGLPLPLKTLKQKIDYARLALLTRNILKESKIGVAYGTIFDSLLSMIAGSRFLGTSNTKISAKIRQNSKSLFGVSIGTRISHLE
jgi:hypothetical protein